MEFGDWRFSLKNTQNNLSFPLLIHGGWIERSRALIYTPLQPGEKREIGRVSFALPALEDGDDPFWQELLKGEEGQEHQLVLKTMINTKNAVNARGDGEVNKTVTLETPITFQSRRTEEMTLLKKWHDDTPPDFFPTVNGARKSLPPRKVLFDKIKQVEHNGSTYQYEGFTTEYPGTPNWPKSLDEWKTLEETFHEGTLRDELRLKRIEFQYKEKSPSVLKELADWFAKMNEIQRSVMAKNIRDRAVACYGNEKLFPPMREIYKSIRKYDVVLIPENDAQHLKNLGLIE